MSDSASNIEAEVIKLLGPKVPAGTQITSATKIVGGLGLDSVGVLDFIMDVEDKFDISIPLERVAEVQTIGELSQAIASLQRAAG